LDESAAFPATREPVGALNAVLIRSYRGVSRRPDGGSGFLLRSAGSRFLQTALGSVKLVGMRRIGLLGGMSWESSAEYYRLVNEATRDRLGGLHSADCVLRSVDFAEIEELQRAEDWIQAGERLAAEARLLEAAGSELLVLCTNTMHKVADVVTAAVGVQLLHIADTTADAVRAAGLSTVGLLATAYVSPRPDLP